MTAQPQIPDGYRLDAKARLIPEDSIKPIDKARDELVQELVTTAIELNRALAQFKAAAFGDIESFVQLSAEEYGVNVGGKKGNVSLLSFDGRYKIQRAIQDHIVFDERLEAAKGLIDECLKDWTDGARSEIKVIVQDAFRTDKQGNLRTGAVLALRRHDFDDPRWLRAMDAISDAVQVTGSKSYIRIYERIGDSDQYRPISLDIAGV
ncbi:DUF3164 family protein [Modicisalibacter sp. MOD 31.J]|uniref:DUF3164 family protein n=1 Tax=Modicisalibacter sp. MOD 31.J TaxID=2831897 RepID=UPI001CCDF53A|nr:DUF3164 family protein [Modicisalibacter sp. MOD 31.J]MBZ9574391.1 DUF3164 family protein [Modicisalibacter sp. MOD 31.J]